MNKQLEILNCDKLFSFVCPKHWDELAVTEAEDERFCSQCNEKVYVCTTLEQMAAHARDRHCVALVLAESPEAMATPNRSSGAEARNVRGRPSLEGLDRLTD